MLDGRQLSPRLSLSRETEHLQRPVRAAMRPLLRGLRLHSLRGMRHRSTRLSLKKNEKMARLRTILPVSELVCNPLGDCIVSLERRIPDSSTSVRIYFKWRVIRELKTPMRVIVHSQAPPMGPRLFDPPAYGGRRSFGASCGGHVLSSGLSANGYYSGG